MTERPADWKTAVWRGRKKIETNGFGLGEVPILET
mgnify:CR=1 FL=1